MKSKRGVQFTIWATNLIKEYMKKGFVLDDNHLKELGGGRYFKELLERIRDIRASEKVFYRQILEQVLIMIQQPMFLSNSLKKYKIRFIMLFKVKLKSFIIE